MFSTVAPLALGWLLAQADPQAHLGALDARRAAEERAAQLLSAREGSILDTLTQSELDLASAEREAHRAEANHATSQRRLHAAQAEEEAARRRLEALQAELPPRLAARARVGRLGDLRLLLSSRSLGELVKRHYLLDAIQAHDAALLSEARVASADRERARKTLQSEARRLAALASETQRRRAAAAAVREERSNLLGAVRNAKDLHERAAAELTGQQQKLADLVAGLPPRTPHAGFSQLRGRLVHPAPGPIEVGFGKVVNPRFNTVTIQKGIDIRAPTGAPVHAVAPGRVVHAGWFKGYGNLVIVDHGDGYHSLVAHLGSMNSAMGEEVEAGTQLGTVGDTGSLKGPYLYFEIREHGRSIDPAQWLTP